MQFNFAQAFLDVLIFWMLTTIEERISRFSSSSRESTARRAVLVSCTVWFCTRSVRWASNRSVSVFI